MSHEQITKLAYDCIRLWNQNKYREAYDAFYSDDAVKVEPAGWGDHSNEIVGKENLADHEEWLTEDWLTINSVSVAEGPFIGANGFAVIIKSDFTFNNSGERHIFREVGNFTVVDGKIAREEYLYDEAEMDVLRRMNEQHANEKAAGEH